jgi:hypothetical protein
VVRERSGGRKRNDRHHLCKWPIHCATEHASGCHCIGSCHEPCRSNRERHGLCNNYERHCDKRRACERECGAWREPKFCRAHREFRVAKHGRELEPCGRKLLEWILWNCGWKWELHSATDSSGLRGRRGNCAKRGGPEQVRHFRDYRDEPLHFFRFRADDS